MKILFIGYWGANEGLSVATINPHLRILSQFSKIEKIIYTSIERSQEKPCTLNIPKVTHLPFYSGDSVYDKIKDYTQLPRKLVALCKKHQIDLIICRGAPAGALGYLVWKKHEIPFCVESFEPHADYMRESGIWHFLSPHYMLSRYWEEQQKKHACLLMPVAKKYQQQLLKEGVSAKRIKTVPCTVDTERFRFDAEKRKQLRQELGIGNDTVVGIYVGKYGGIYMDERSFNLYREAFRYWQKFFLIILSPRIHHIHIHRRVAEFALPKDKVVIKEAKHRDVPGYLSVSDLAFATYVPGRFKAFLSPIKVGEYWANGLPIILTEGVGDAAAIIDGEKIGTIITKKNCGSFAESYKTIQRLIDDKNHRSRIQTLAQKYRARIIVKRAYEYLIQYCGSFSYIQSR